MSVSDNYLPLKELGNGVTTEFSAGWPVFNSDYLLVYLEDATTGDQVLQILDTDYTLVFNSSGFTVTFIVPPPNTQYVVIGRSIDLTQTNPYRTAQGFQGDKIENSFDKITAITQDLQDELNRTPKLALGSSIVNPLLPVPDAGKAIIWNPAENGFVNSDDDINGITASAEASAAAALVSETNAAASASSASASAVLAAESAARFVGSSVSSVLIGTGSKSFTTQTDKLFAGQQVIVSSMTDTSNYMFGNVSSYDAGTGAMIVNVTAVGGTGTFSDWLISVSGVQGIQGATGAPGAPGAGTGDVVGPASSVDNRVAVYNGTSGKVLKDGGIVLGTISSQNSNGVTITGGTISGITDMAVGDGGTGASDASGARTNLGLGNVQNVDQTNADNITSGTLDIARVASGTPDGTKFVRDDGVLAVPPATIPTAYGAVNTYAFSNTNGQVVAGGSTVTNLPGALSGTWRNMSSISASTSQFALFVRIS
jgi:hypothetical protein